MTRAKYTNFRQRTETCRFCGGWFMSGGNGAQSVCYRQDCRAKLKEEWRQNDMARKRELAERRKRKLATGPGNRNCLKCGMSFKSQGIHNRICNHCKYRVSDENSYADAWGELI